MNKESSFDERKRKALALIKSKVLAVPLDKWSYKTGKEGSHFYAELGGKEVSISIATVFQQTICLVLLSDVKVLENDNDIFQHAGVIKKYLKEREQIEWLHKVEEISKSLE